MRDAATSVLAIDLGGSKLEMGLVDGEGRVLASHRRELTGLPYTREALLECMRQGGRALLAGSPTKPRAVGISIPGPYDPLTRTFLGNFSSGIGDWRIPEDVEALFSLPVYGDNDVNACAVAEKRFGSCREASDYLWITVSYGCGGALFLNNALYRGAGHMAGEVGHIVVDKSSPRRCGCGLYGDLEAQASGSAIGSIYLQQKGLPADPAFKSKQVGELARAGDAVAAQVFWQAGYHLGRVCAMAANMLNLQKAVLGGGVAVYDWALLQPGLTQALEDGVFKLFRDTFTVEPTALGYHASLLGAAALALDGV